MVGGAAGRGGYKYGGGSRMRWRRRRRGERDSGDEHGRGAPDRCVISPPSSYIRREPYFPAIALHRYHRPLLPPSNPAPCLPRDPPHAPSPVVVLVLAVVAAHSEQAPQGDTGGRLRAWDGAGSGPGGAALARGRVRPGASRHRSEPDALAPCRAGRGRRRARTERTHAATRSGSPQTIHPATNSAPSRTTNSLSCPPEPSRASRRIPAASCL